jgi:hypothetical protein
MELGELIDKYGSDKKVSGYDYFYAKIFEKIRFDKIDYLEIGLGTLQPEIPSTFIGIKQYLTDNVLSPLQEFIVRLSYPVIIFLFLWIIKSL